MFNVGDYIVYGHNGICQVKDITYPDIAGSDNNRLYYVLDPIKVKDGTLFCPADNDRIVIRKVIDENEALTIISEAGTIEPLDVKSERMRDECYKNAVKSCDLRQCMQLIKTLLARKAEREAQGKKVTSTDDRYLKLAEESLYGELAIATGKDVDEIRDLILSGCAD